MAYIHNRQLIEDVSKYTPYFSKSGRVGRGLIDFYGYYLKFMFGVATQDDLTKLHADNNVLIKRLDNYKEALIQQHKYLADVTSNLTVWSKQLSKSYEEDLANVERSFHRFEASSYAGETALARVTSLIQQNQQLIRLASRMEAVADMCR